jgi:class I fructose-bisphosphate aldolase
VISSGGASVSDETLFDEVRSIHAGGGFGSIIGRNSFQQSQSDALKMFNTIMNIYNQPSQIQIPVVK